jgi:hypothetical protein
MSAVNPKLELARLKDQWWWTDTKKRIISGVNQRDVEAAKVWELLRRTKTYRLLYHTFNKALRQIHGHRLLLPIFHARVCGLFGNEIGCLVMSGGDPNLTWVELLEQTGGKLQWPSLPRQQSPAEILPLSIFIWEITRNKGRERISKCDWDGSGFEGIEPPGMKVLPSKTSSQRYVVIRFDVRLGEDALHEQLDRELKARFGLPPKTDLKKHSEDSVTADKIIYPVLWKPTTLTSDPHHSADDARLTASRDQPYALCWIPDYHNLKTVCERFHNQVRPENLKPKVKAFQKIWQREKVTVQKWTGEFSASTGQAPSKPVYENKTVQVYPRPENLPHDLSVRRAGEIKWESICALDHRVKKLNCPVTAFLFDCYRRDSGETLKSHQEKDTLLKNWRNGRAAVTRRLQEIDAKLPPVGDTFRLIWDDLFKHDSSDMRPKLPC